MFKTMNGVEVYDKQDIDASLGLPTEGVAGTAFERITAAEQRLTQAENDLTSKATKTEVGNLVRTEVDNTIETKVNEVAGTLENTIDTKITNMTGTAVSAALSGYDTKSEVTSKIAAALSGYDTSSAVDNKISTAIGNIPAGPSAMTTSEATDIINSYF